MSNRSIMNKSSFYSRRKIIICLIVTILSMVIFSGFTNTFDTDNTIHKASYGETIVMEAAPPESGSPAHFDALSNLKYAAYRLHHASSFRGETDGVAVADIGFTTYSQHLRNTRVVMNENKVFAETVSSSSLKNLGEQKYIEDDIVIFRPSEKVSNGKATFSPTAYRMSFDKFSDGYGAVPNQLSKYIINEKTILSVTDENAPASAAALNSKSAAYADEAESEGITYYVPESLVADENGNYKFSITLDPETSTVYYRNEVRTLGGADQNPKFYSAKITFEIAGDWTPIRVTTVENYDIAIPVLGAMNCTGTNVETFYDVDSVTELPEHDFYKPYVDEAKKSPGYVSPEVPIVTPGSPADYLAAAFADYMTGEKDLALTIDVTSDAISAYGLELSVNLKTFETQAMLGDLYVKYAGDKVYIRLNELNGYIPVSEFSALLQDERVSGVLSGLGNFDFAGLFGDDMLGTIFANCEMNTENGVTCIRIPFSLDLSEAGMGDVAIDASIFIDDESKALKSVKCTVTVNGAAIGIEAQPPRRAPRFPSVEGATDISGALDFIPDLITTLQQKTLFVSGTVTVAGNDIGVSAYIDRNDGFKIDGVISALGLDIAVKYADGNIYASLGNINVRGTADELPVLINAVLELTGTDMNKYADVIKLLMPSTLSDFIGMVKSLEVTDDRLDIGLGVLTIPIDIGVTRGDGAVTGIDLGVKVDMFGIKLDAAAKLKIEAQTAHETELPSGEFISFEQLAGLIASVKPYLESDAFNVTLGASFEAGGARYDVKADVSLVGTQKAAGTLTALGQTAQITYTDETAYIALGSIKLKLNVNDIDKLSAPIARLIRLLAPANGNAEGNGTDNIIATLLSKPTAVAVNEDGALVIKIAVGEYELDITADLESGVVTATDRAGKLNVTLTLAPATDVPQITAPSDANNYVDLAALDVTLDKLAQILEQKSLSASAEISVSGISVPLAVALDFNDGLKLEISQTELGLNVRLINDILYIALGNIKISGKASDLPALLSALDGIIPSGLTSGIGSNDADAAKILAAIVNAVTELTLSNGTLELDALLNKAGISLELSVALDNASLAVTFGETLVSINVSEITAAPVSIIAPADSPNYVQVQKLIPTVRKIAQILEQKSLSASAEISVGGISVPLAVALDFNDGLKLEISQTELGLNVRLINDTLYIALGNIKISGKASDLPALLNALDGIIPNELSDAIGMLTSGNAFDKASVLNTVKAVVNTITRFAESDGTLFADVAYNGVSASLAIVLDLSEITANVAVNDVAVKLGISDMTAEPVNIAAPIDAQSYVKASALVPAAEKAAKIFKQKSLALSADIGIGNTSLSLDAEISFDGIFKLRAVERSLGLEITVIGKTAYVALGDVRVAGSLDDIPALLELLDGIIPQNAANAVTELLNGNPFDGTDVLATVKSAIGMISGFDENDGMLYVQLDIDGMQATVRAANDLCSLGIALTVDGTDVQISAYDVTVKQVNIAVSGSYVPLATLIAAAKPIMPLASAQGLSIGINARMLGVPVNGSVHVFFGGATEKFSIDANVRIGDVPVRLTVKDDTLYLSAGTTIRVYESLSAAALLDIAAKLDYALPGIKATVEDLMTQTQTVSLQDILSCIALVPSENGFDAVLDMNKLGTNARISLGVTVNDGVLSSVSIDCDLGGTTINAVLDAVLTDGALGGLTLASADDKALEALELTVEKSGYIAYNINKSEYIKASRLTEYIAPLFDIITASKTAKTISLGIDASLITPANEYTRITGGVTLSLAPLAVDARITLFADTENATELYITYVGTTLYIKVGQLELSLDTAKDFERLYNVLSDYLPGYLNDELAKLLGLKSGASAFSDMSLMIDKFKSLANASDAAQIVSALFSPLEGINSDSAVKTLLDMLSIADRGDELTVGLNVMGITLNLTPHLSADKTTLVSATLDTVLAGYSLKLDVTSLDLAADAVTISAPDGADNYMSVMQFVEAIDRAVKTFTETDENGDITFELKTFDFDYEIFAVETTTDEFGNTVTVKDDAGRDKPLKDQAGNKVVDKTVKVYNKPGYSALKGKFVKDELLDDAGNAVSVSYKFNLEAHIVLDISSLKNSTPLTLDLYVINNDDHNGIAFLDYLEGNGNGERISIDYESVMQIVAAALDIIGIDDDIVDMLLGDYRLDIDTSVFDSMDIAGLDDIKDMLTKLVAAVQDVKDGIAAAKEGWDLIATAGSIKTLNERTDEIKVKFEKALSIVQAVISSFTNEQPAETPEATEINGKLFKDIVDGVCIRGTDSSIVATVDNDIATGTDGVSTVTVTQNGNVIDRVNVNGLDVNTAKLKNFDAQFSAGESITVALPDNYNTTQGKSVYSDFSNIKHLLFDVMNTANMLEFEMGDANATTNENKIELGIKLLGVESIKVDIRYNVKVRIIDQGASASPRYKTAAIVELIFKDCKAAGATLVPNCTTKLYFYDNVIYVRGLEYYSEKKWYGTEWHTRSVDVAYTVEQLGNMLSSDNGMEKLMYEFLFYMLPLSREFTIFKVDLQEKIASSVSAPSTGADPVPTIATVFKGYSYNDGIHAMTIGLSELAEAPDSNMLGDLNVTFTGKNDGDDNILDNYISAASITTSLVNNSACTVNVRLFAELRNTEIFTDTDEIQKLRSKGLTNTTDNYTLNDIINSVIPGTSWQYVWA